MKYNINKEKAYLVVVLLVALLVTNIFQRNGKKILIYFNERH